MAMKNRRYVAAAALLVCGLLGGCIPPTAPGEERCVGDCAFRAVNTYPHDPKAFTQGLIFLDGVLYEGTGLNGQSSLRRVALETGTVTQRADLDSAYFGEGIAVAGDRIYQLTWRSKVGFIYDRESFAVVGQFHYTTEGWGLTFDGEHLILSDGTARLFFHDPADFSVQREITVTENGAPVPRLNELEYIDGAVWANVWQTNSIVRIAPDTGVVLERIDLTGLLTTVERLQADVLNGIAYDAVGNRIFVTGKHWPKLFEIRRAE